MSDPIERQDALDALRTCYDTNLVVLDNGDELIHYGDAVGAIETLPSAQPTGTNTVQVEDCISRAAIVDAIEGVDWYHMTDSGEMVHGANSAEHQAWYKAEDIYAAIEGVPQAQPVEDARAMCGECDAWNRYKNYPQPGWISWDKNTQNSMVFTLRTVLNGGDMDAVDRDNIKRLLALMEGGQDG